MFEVITGIFSAWNILAMLLISGVCFLIGGLMAAHIIRWRFSAVKLPARIKAVHVVGEKTHLSDKPLTNEKNVVPSKWFVAFMVILPLLFSAMGIYTAAQYYILKSGGEYTQATVIRNDMNRDSDGAVTYKAVIHFVDLDGRTHELRDSISYGEKPSFEEGTQVGIYYNRNNPRDFIIDDFWHNMLGAIGFIVFGLVFVAFVLWAVHMMKRQTQTVQGDTFGSYHGEVYYPLYEYRLPDASTGDFMDKNGSNAIAYNLPGRKTTLLVMPDSGEIERIGMVLPIVTLIFLGAGFFVAHQLVAQFEFSLFLPLLFIAFFGVLGVKGWMSAQGNQKSRRYMEEKWKAKASTIRGRALEAHEITARLKDYNKKAGIGSLIGIIVAVGFLAGAYYASGDMMERAATGVQTQGVVTDLDRRRSKSSDGGTSYMYYSVIEFTDHSGRTISFRDSVGSNRPIHKRGQEVSVLYMPEDANDAIIDRGIWNWALAALLGVLGLLTALGSLHHLLIVRRRTFQLRL